MAKKRSEMEEEERWEDGRMCNGGVPHGCGLGPPICQEICLNA